MFVCDNLAFHSDISPVTRKHTKHFAPVEVIDVALGKMQRHFEPMRREIDVWRDHSLADTIAKSIIFDAFVADGVDAPKHLAREVALRYFAPEHPEFEARNLWTLSTGFTSACKALEPVPQMRAIADTQEEAREAQKAGWRTFRILTPGLKPAATETICRNVRTGTACQACGLCAGAGLKAKHVAMPLHRSKRVHFYRNVEVATRRPPVL